MSWSEQEWSTFCVLVEDWWPGEMSESQVRSWRVALDPVEPAAAKAALGRLLHGGHTFRPSVSELLAEVRRDPSRPTFPEAFTLIFGPRGVLRAQPARMGGLVVYERDGDRRRAEHAAILERADGMHPLIRPFVERQGIDRLRTLPVDDPQWGERHRRDLEAAWDAHVEAMDGREVAVLASGATREGLRQLDPLAALGAGRKELAA